MLLLATAVAAAAPTPSSGPPMAEIFPQTALPTERAAALLTPDRIGPPALTYDQTTRTEGAAHAEERALEAAIFGKAPPPAPDSLRRYARMHLALAAEGRPDARAEWFLAEHVGLATLPETAGVFYTSDPSRDTLAKGMASWVDRDEVRAAVVVLEHDDARNLWRGELDVLYGAAAFEPFPRTGKPGSVVVVPGTLLAQDARYGLYVTQPGPGVSEYPLAGKGAFDVEIPLPAEPGAYRVAMNRIRKRRLPDSAFFFTIYVGVEPPASFAATGVAQVGETQSIEEEFLARVNTERARYGLSPLGWADRRQELADALANLPPRDRRLARWRYMNQVVERDPLPTAPHGNWTGGLASGNDMAEAAWAAIEHPITRASLLAPESATLVAGATDGTDGVTVLTFVLERGADADAGRTLVWKELDRVFGGSTGVTRAPALQARLDGVAGEVASGKRTMKAAMRDLGGDLKEASKAGEVGGAMGWAMYVAPAGQAPDLSGYTAPNGCKTFAVGAATGDLGTGDGHDRTVFVIVAAGTAR